MLSKFGKMVVDARMHLIFMTGVFSLCCITPNVVQAIPLSAFNKQVYFFGDSLSDSGFNNTYNSIFVPSTPVNKAPNFTTYGDTIDGVFYPGYAWSQYLAQDITGIAPLPPTAPFPNPFDPMTNNTTPINPPGPPTLPLDHFNYACGGARTDAEPGITFPWAPSVTRQVQNYLENFAPPKLDPKALYVIWSGANDMLYGFEQYRTPIDAPKFMALIDQTTSQVVHLVKMLSDRGARRFLVMSLPNIGVTPFILSFGTEAEQNAKNLTFIFNTSLNQKLGYFLKKHKQVKILYFDAYKALDQLIQHAQKGEATTVDGEKFYFDNVTDPACPEPLSISCTVPYRQNNMNYLFADSVHPSGLAHLVLAKEVERQIRLWRP